MPPPVLLAPGAIMAVKHMAFQASAYVDMSTFTSATFAVLLARWIWKRVPMWIKQDITFQKLLRRSDGGITRDELSHIGSVFDKIKALAQSSQIEPVEHLHAALLAYIQLSGQLKLQQVQTPHEVEESSTRDYLYQTSGKQIPLESLRCQELQDALEFATWAYYDDTELLKEKLDSFNYTVLSHKVSSRPGTVSYYLAVDPEQKQILVGVRGTTSLEDIMTDCCGRAVPLDALEDDTVRIEVHAKRSNSVLESEGGDGVEVVSGHERIALEDHDDDGDKFIRCHEGILISAENLVAEIEPLITDLVRNCEYRLVLCGHSLGAGAAALAAVILRNHFTCLIEQVQRLHVYGFAPPPTLDYDSAIAASLFCTSVVCNADIIPRCSLYNMALSFEILRSVQERLVEEDLIPTGPIRTQAFLRKLAEGTGGEKIINASDLKTVAETASQQVEIRKREHLFIPGRVLLAYNPWLGGNGDSELNEPHSITWRCIETDGAAAAFRNLEFDGPRPFADHMTTSYFGALGIEYEF